MDKLPYEHQKYYKLESDIRSVPVFERAAKNKAFYCNLKTMQIFGDDGVLKSGRGRYEVSELLSKEKFLYFAQK